ncbi:TPA: insulinase family protein [Streptococcus pneumoniae]|nr:zinc-dependent protease [Streptococcus pneumoniae]HET1162402.1 insulinase family protein [Streptococcus pneumoniae]HET1457048.1 insulinase family protein [Streptococcus pneumoniae]
MELVHGISTHFIQSKKFKTNKITVRFTAPLSLDTIAGHMLSASMLETANQMYPTSQDLRRHLASLYGTDMSTNCFRRGQSHIIELTFTYVRDEFLSRKNVLTSQILELVKETLFSPVVVDNGFDPALFEIEKKQLLASLAADMDDSFYFAHKELDKLFFHDERLQLEYSDLRNRILAETPQSSYSCFQEFLANDRIDFFFLGDFNEVEIQNVLESFGFKGRKGDVKVQYCQPYSNILQEGMVRKNVGQSILELGYHYRSKYGDEQHLPMIVMNGLLGGFAHSKLFTNVRENAGLAYTISSELDLKKGYFTEFELNQTKEMIRWSLLLSQDNQSSLIERAYQNALFGKSSADFKSWIAKLEQIDKDAICRVANNVKLQAIYFMEGIE